MNSFSVFSMRIVNLLRSLFGRPVEPMSKATLQWGPAIEIGGLRDIYGPHEIRRFTATPGGIDNLALSSTDTFFVHGKGEFKVDFDGYFRVARANPTTNDWATAEFFVNIIDLQLTGQSEELGPIRVRLNPDAISAGQVFAAGASTAPAKCRIAAGAIFELPKLGYTLFNREPILLMNGSIKSVPPVEDPNGKAHLYNLPLYDVNRPNSRPVAYITSLVYTVGNYITRERAEAIRSAYA